MKPEAQRIAIAEACGWNGVRRSSRWEFSDTDPDTDWCGQHPVYPHLAMPLPDYLNDLNAMHDAESVLNKRQREHFIAWLDRAVLPRAGVEMTYAEAFVLAHATAAQRAEAFLRTLNLWKDEA